MLLEVYCLHDWMFYNRRAHQMSADESLDGWIPSTFPPRNSISANAAANIAEPQVYDTPFGTTRGQRTASCKQKSLGTDLRAVLTSSEGKYHVNWYWRASMGDTVWLRSEIRSPIPTDYLFPAAKARNVQKLIKRYQSKFVVPFFCQTILANHLLRTRWSNISVATWQFGRHVPELRQSAAVLNPR
jgi:hypothetical protein